MLIIMLVRQDGSNHIYASLKYFTPGKQGKTEHNDNDSWSAAPSPSYLPRTKKHHPSNHILKMLFSSSLTLVATLLTLTTAIPTNNEPNNKPHIRRSLTGVAFKPLNQEFYPVGGNAIGNNPPYAAIPTGTAPGVPYPTGTSSPFPIPTGSLPCTTSGSVVCAGPKLFGLCDNGAVQFRPVAPGTACLNGKIVSEREIYAIIDDEDDEDDRIGGWGWWKRG